MSSQEDYLDSLLKGIVEDEDSDANDGFQSFDMSDVDDLLRSVSEQFFAGEDILGSSDDIEGNDDIDEIDGISGFDDIDGIDGISGFDDIDGIGDIGGIEDSSVIDDSDGLNDTDGSAEIDLADLFASSDLDASEDSDDFNAQEIQDLLEQTDLAQTEPDAVDLASILDATPTQDAIAEENEDDDVEYEPNSDDTEDLIALLQGAGEEEMDIPSLSDITDVELPEHTNQEETSIDDISLEELLDDMNSLTADSDVTSGESDSTASSDMESLMGAVGIGDLFGVASEEDLASTGGMDDGIANLMDLDLGQDEGKIASKKGGFFSRIWNFLTEADEEEEKTTQGNEDVPLSDENKTVIEEVEKEKKNKKKDKKKKKKGQQENEEVFEGEEGAEADDNKKKKQKKKKEKKKTDESAEGLEPPVPEKKLSNKRVAVVGAICLTIGLVIFICSDILSDFMVKDTAREAFYNEDYFTCYQNLYGKDLNESDEVMLRKSECILRIRLWVQEYKAFEAAGSEVEALDSLIQSVNDYAELKAYAAEWAIDAEIANEYASILNILTEKYQLTEEQAREIAAIKDDVQYTKVVVAIAGGEIYGEAPKREERLEDLKDVLPEEKELLEKIF